MIHDQLIQTLFGRVGRYQLATWILSRKEDYGLVVGLPTFFVKEAVDGTGLASSEVHHSLSTLCSMGLLRKAYRADRKQYYEILVASPLWDIYAVGQDSLAKLEAMEQAPRSASAGAPKERRT
jgi:hypothetical protein